MFFTDTTTGIPLLDWLAQVGATGILAFIVLAFFKGWIVPSSRIGEMREDLTRTREERDKALNLVYKQAEIAQRALEVGEKP